MAKRGERPNRPSAPYGLKGAWIDVSVMTPQELSELNRRLSRTISERGRRLRETKGEHGRKIGQKSFGYQEAVRHGWIKPRTKTEKRKSPKEKTAFGKKERLEQEKEVRAKINWLKDPLNSRSGIRHAIDVLGTSDSDSMPYRLYDMMNDEFPSLSYEMSKNPRRRYNSDYYLDKMFEIVEESEDSVDEMLNKMRELARKEYEEQQRQNEEDDRFLHPRR